MSGAVLAVAFVAVAAGLGAWWGWLVRWKSVKATRDNPLGRRFAVQIALLATSYAVAFACVPERSRNWLIVPLVAAGLFLVLCVRRRLRKELRQAGSPPIKKGPA